MRFTLFIIIFISLCSSGFAQSERSIKSLRAEADRFYDEEQYHLAIQYYRELADLDVKDVSLSYRLAECYMKTFNYPEAEAYYLKVYFQAPSQYPLSLYYYALMLKLNASFDEAMEYFAQFIAIHKGNAELKEFVEQAIIDRSGCETAKEDMGSAINTPPPAVLKFNSAYNDFAPAVKDSSTLVITSGRVSSNRQSIDERYGEGFTDNYYLEKVGSAWTDKTKQLFSITNSKYNDGSGCFNSKGDKYYFSVCGKDGPQCKIYVTSFKDNKWTEPLILNSNINFKSYESKHPAISFGGDTLIFASNRNGGQGKFDLWMSVNSGNDDWGPAMNLGGNVNTKLNELTPALTAFQNVLFFSSDGHEGYGGLDLYMSKTLSTGEIVIYNLGVPFNSNSDDSFLSFADRDLYWSSNRTPGLGGFDILSVRITSPLAFISKLSLKKRNASRNIMLKSKTEESQKINLQATRLEERIDYDQLDSEKKRIVDRMLHNFQQHTPNSPDMFKLPAVEYDALLKIAESRYSDRQNQGYLAKVRAPLGGEKDFSVTGVLVDSLSGKRPMGRNVLLTDDLGEVLKITRTNAEGKFKFTDVAGSKEFYIRTEPIVPGEKPIIKDLAIVGSSEQKLVHFENIYFDFDHYRLRPEAIKVLDELAAHLIKNPGVQLEIFAFADDRGTNEYNFKLTQKRGQSVVEYLSSKGVDQTGLAIVAKGKQAPREVDLDLQRQYNRRVEFYLNGNGETFAESSRTYILRRKVDWTTIAEITGISKAVLKEVNGATDEQLKAFQPVRIPNNAKPVSSDLFF
ncbi:MAG TPA: OmpA family protein [Chryseolinea sp.]|nr:OmpA family protein [Chryseolinea sp.]